MSWDITTKEKALFETVLLSWEEPLLDEPGEFSESEMPDTTARPLNLEEEVNSPTNDDGDHPFPEPPVEEEDDHSEDETQVEEPDPVTEESRDVVREPLRLPQRRLPEEGVESKSKKVTCHCVNVSEFLAKAARSQEKQRLGLNGRDKLLFLEAVSKQWNAWQENAAATARTSGGSQGHLANSEETRFCKIVCCSHGLFS